MSTFQYIIIAIMFVVDMICNFILVKRLKEMGREIEDMHDRLDSEDLPGTL